MSTSQVLLTYSPLADRKHTMLGVHLRVHNPGGDQRSSAKALGDLASVWPQPPSLVLVDFAHEDHADPIFGWQPPESVVVLTKQVAPQAGPSRLHTNDPVPRRCVVLSEIPHPTSQDAAYLAAPASSLAELSRWVGRVKSPIVVLDVNEPIDHARAANAGVAAIGGWSCLGWKRRPADKKVGLLSNILKLLQLIERDADTVDVEAIFKRDAVLSYKLVSMANSAALGAAVEVTSLRHALNILGRQKLKRWLSLLLLQAGGSDTPQVLLQIAFIRAAFLERVGAALSLDAEKEDLFLCGAFSLLDKILGIPLTELLGRISISEAITDALVGDEGSLAPLLNLIKGVEAKEALYLAAQCDLLAISPQEVNEALLSAISSTKEVSSL